MTKTEKAKLVKEAQKRLKTRMVQCDKCFSPRNTLTVKTHVGEIWGRPEINITDKGVNLPCKGCKNMRYLSLGQVSLGIFGQEYKDYAYFVLLKDGKWNSLVGVDKIDMSIKFSDIIDKDGELIK